MFSFWKSIFWSSPKKDGNGEVRDRPNHEDKMGSISSSQCSGKDGQGDGVADHEQVVAHSHDNGQVATEIKVPTTPPCRSVTDELLNKPIDTVNIQSVTEAKELTTSPSFAVVHEPSEDRMNTDNGQVAIDIKTPNTPPRSPAADEPFEKPVDTANVQPAPGTKVPTNLPCPSVIDELLKEPVNSANVQSVIGAKASTTSHLSSVIDEPSEEPMVTDIGQVADEADVIEQLGKTMETVTSTSEVSIVIVDSDEDWEMMSNDGESRPAKQNAYVEWEMKQKACLARYLVRRQKETLKRFKIAKTTGKVCRMPNKFWQKCAKEMKKMGHDKNDLQCSNQKLVICAFTKDKMKIHFGFDDEEADLLCGLWGRKKKQTKTPKKGTPQATPRAERHKETWMPDEETEFVSYLVRDCKKYLREMSEGSNVSNFFMCCEKQFKGARSRNSYRNMARIMRKYEDDILKNEHKLTDDEIELLRKPWLDRKKK